MKTIKILVLLAIFIGFSSCDKDDDQCTETQWFADADGDGLGDADNSLMACEQPQGYVNNSNDNDDTQVAMDLVENHISNLHAPQEGGQGQPISGDFTKFDFAIGITTTSDTDWDIAFRGTDIIINGGVSFGATDEPARNGDAAAYIATGTLASVVAVETASLEQDSVNGYVLSSWYTYSGPPNHTITPTAGKILVIRTRDGNYAKIEILSYYKDAPEVITLDSESRYYTFNYVYQPNNGVSSF